ncbi:MAG TPA: hypothetical protein V6D20_13185 [Candidatus Obscuribacterales bacterium]
MSWLEAIANAGSGGLIGILGSGISGWLKIKGMKAQAEIDVAMARLQIDAKTIETDSEDFRASQEAAQKESESLVSVSSIATSDNQRWVLIWLHFLRSSVRPALAYTVHIIAAIVYFTSPEEFRHTILQQIFTMAFAYGGWYFGQRELNKRLFSDK